MGKHCTSWRDTQAKSLMSYTSGGMLLGVKGFCAFYSHQRYSHRNGVG